MSMAINDFPQALSIAGFDSDGSAGMPADLHSIFANKVYGLGIITANVAGNSKGIFAQQLMPLDFIQKEFDAINDDFKVKALKTGMLGTKEITDLVADNLEKYDIPKVIDPVIITKHGAMLLKQDAYDAFIKRILPLATVVTPNFYEGQKLTDMKLDSKEAYIKAAHKLQKMGAKNVMLKGQHGEGSTNVDDLLLLESGKEIWLDKPYFDTTHINGTGDTLSATIAAQLALGKSVEEAVKIAKDFTYQAISHPINVGHKFGPINHLANL